MEAFEAQQAGKRQSWANIIANIESEATPYTSMIEKRSRASQVLHTWQVKGYPVTGHRGVVDGRDATSFDSNPRSEVQCRGQKTWRKPGVSDFADEAEIVNLNGGEMAEQIADSMVTVKRQIEKRCLSNEDTQADDGQDKANETRGIFVWTQSAAQGNLPVPAGFRTPAAQIWVKPLAQVLEDPFLALFRSSYKQRKGPFKLQGFVGVDLKAQLTSFSKYVDNVANKTPVRQFKQDADTKAMVITMDKLVLDTGEVDLHLSSFLYTDPNTGADTNFTHSSGVFVDENMCGLAYTRMPRVVRLPYAGGGQKAIVDAIFLHMADNVLGAVQMKIDGTQ